MIWYLNLFLWFKIGFGVDLRENENELYTKEVQLVADRIR